MPHTDLCDDRRRAAAVGGIEEGGREQIQLRPLHFRLCLIR